MYSETDLRRWKAKMGAGRMAYNIGMYRQAASNFHAALELLEGAGLPEEFLSLTLVSLAKTLGSSGDFAEAERLLKKALELDQAASSQDGEFLVELIEDFHQLSLLYWRAGKLELAENSLNEAYQYLKIQPGVPDELKAKLMKHKAVLAELSGDYQQCGKLIDAAIDFILGSRALGRFSLIYADCLMVKVVLLTELNKFDEALEIYQEAIQGMEITRGEAHPKTLELLQLLSEQAGRKGLVLGGLTKEIERSKAFRKRQSQ